jgi:hypothetical protein
MRIYFNLTRSAMKNIAMQYVLFIFRLTLVRWSRAEKSFCCLDRGHCHLSCILEPQRNIVSLVPVSSYHQPPPALLRSSSLCKVYVILMFHISRPCQVTCRPLCDSSFRGGQLMTRQPTTSHYEECLRTASGNRPS